MNPRPYPQRHSQRGHSPWLCLSLLGGLLLAGYATLSLAAERRAGSLQTLATLGRELESQHGIRFTVDADLGRDTVQPPSGSAPRAADIPVLLKGYNWIGTYGADGRLTTVHITGRNGDGQDAGDSHRGKPLITYRKRPRALPARYAGYPTQSVYPIDIPVKRLRAMRKGADVTLNLPRGTFLLRHDQTWAHRNGDTTWAARLSEANSGLASRTLLTLTDAAQVEGQINTPDGLYLVESDATGQWLIDLKASGLLPGRLDQDASPPFFLAPPAAPTITAGAGPAQAIGAAGPGALPSPATAAQQTRINVLLLLPASGLTPSGHDETRLNLLLALANQALLDSRISVSLQLAGVERLAQAAQGDNHQLLVQLSTQQAAFDQVQTLRERHAADLVMLVHPFSASSATSSCGEAWVNGSNATVLSPALSYAVVSDGRAGGYYCSNYTLAHELGHLLGAAHDRPHAAVAGHFPYSFGYGLPGHFGDIMSYIDPEAGLYANPELHDCFGFACGIAIGQPGAADVASTLRLTAPIVAGFAP